MNKYHNIEKNKNTTKTITEGVVTPLVKFQVKIKSHKVSQPNLNLEKKFSEINGEIENNENKKKKTVFPYNRQDDAFKQQSNDSQLIIAQSRMSYSGCQYNLFNVIENYQDLVKLIIQTQPEYRTFNEVITLNQKVKLGFDLEWIDKPSEDGVENKECPRYKANYYDKDITLTKFCEKLGQLCLKIFNKPLNPENYLIICNSRLITGKHHQVYYKNSYHIFIINYGHLPNLSIYHKKFTQLLIESFGDNDPIFNNRLMVSSSGVEYLSKPIDTSVYKNNQTMRCIMCTKPNKQSFLMPTLNDYDKPISDFFWAWITDNDPPLDLYLLEKNIPKHSDYIVSVGLHKHSNFDKTFSKSLVPPHLIEYIQNILSKMKPERATQYQEWFDIACILISIHDGLFNVFNQWSSQASNYDATACQKLWESLYQSKYSLKNLIEKYKEDNGSNDAEQNDPEPIVHLGYTWKYYYQQTPRNPLKKSIENNYWGANLVVDQESLYVKSNQIDLENLIDKMVTGQWKTIIIKAPCGGAKTDFYVKLVTLLWTRGLIPKNFLIVSPLKSLAHSLQGRFMNGKKPFGWGDNDPNPNDVDLKFYKDIDTYEDLVDTNINVVVNSLPKLANFGQGDYLDHYQRDLLIFDEWKSFLINMCRKTLSGRRRLVVSQLEYYIKNAKYIIVIDQNIDDDCLESLYSLRDPLTSVIFDYQKPNACDQTVYELSDLKKTLEILDDQYLSKNKFVYICSNAKKHGADLVAEYIKQNYPEITLKKYTSDTSEEDKMKLANCEEEWDTYVVCSPTISHGVDHSKENVFHATFCFLKGYSLPPSMVVQQIKRVRKLIDKNIYICNLNKPSNELIDLSPSSIKNQIITRLNQNSLVPKSVKPIFNHLAGDQNSLVPKLDKQAIFNSPILGQTNLTKELKKMDKIYQNEIQSLVLGGHSGECGQSVLNDSWFSTIYQFYMRTELEGCAHLMDWVRGYLCQTGVQYYIELSDIDQESDSKKIIQSAIGGAKESVDDQIRNDYLDAPTYTIIDITQKQWTLNSYGITKYWHCKMVGLKMIDGIFYDLWIKNNKYMKIRNLIYQLQSDSQIDNNSDLFMESDFPEMEKIKTGRALLNQFLNIIGLNLIPFFFTGFLSEPISSRQLTHEELNLISDNQKDLTHYFGNFGRVRGKMTQLHQLYRFVGRLLDSYLGIKFDCQQKRYRDGKIRSYSYHCELNIPNDIYEILSYRVISHRNETIKWLLPENICNQLKVKFRSIERIWGGLSAVRKWPNNCLLDIDTYETEKEQLQRKSDKEKKLENIANEDARVKKINEKKKFEGIKLKYGVSPLLTQTQGLTHTI